MNRDELRKTLYIKNEYGVEHQNPDAVLTQEQIDFSVKTWGINSELHKTCLNCQIRHMLKYEGFMNDEVKVTKFEVPCSGIAKTLPAGSGSTIQKMIATGMEPERAQLLVAASAGDPVAWAELMFGFKDSDPTWKLRKYQKEILRCTSRSIVLRWGRRSGKTFTIALKLLYLIFNYSVELGNDSEGKVLMGGPSIMIVTPFLNQVSNIFNEMEKLLKRNPDLMRMVETSSASGLFVKTPIHRMEFATTVDKDGNSRAGAIVSGFVSGVGTKMDGSGGGTMRGSSADIIYMDEFDMIPGETFSKVIQPILLSNLKGEPIMIVSSTPIGQRGAFHKMCKENSFYKEDHLPTTVLPHWPKIKREALQSLTLEGIQIELCAAFIDTAYGAFKTQDIRLALRSDFSYSDIVNAHDIEQFNWWKTKFGITSRDQMIRCMGIDWNKGVGAEFVVVTYIPHLNRWILTDVVNIPGGEFNGVRWTREFIRLNHKWKPDYIYPDEGYGHTVIEQLQLLCMQLAGKEKKTAEDLSTMQINDRMHPLNASSNIELRDPVTNQKKKKHAKLFLVENARRIFEEKDKIGNSIIWIPEEERQLKAELEHYIQKSVNPTNGKPIYGTDSPSIGDHRLDAFMLACGGIQIETGAFSDPDIAGTINYLSKEESELMAEAENLPLGDAYFKPMNGAKLDIMKLLNNKLAESNKGYRVPRRAQTEDPGEARLADIQKKYNIVTETGDPDKEVPRMSVFTRPSDRSKLRITRRGE